MLVAFTPRHGVESSQAKGENIGFELQPSKTWKQALVSQSKNKQGVNIAMKQPYDPQESNTLKDIANFLHTTKVGKRPHICTTKHTATSNSMDPINTFKE